MARKAYIIQHRYVVVVEDEAEAKAIAEAVHGEIGRCDVVYGPIHDNIEEVAEGA
jgi:hypothetical protein